MSIREVQLPPRKPRKAPKRPVARRKPKTTKISLWRAWNVPDGAYHRYEGLKGIYWYWLSRDVREQDWLAFKICLTCLEVIEDWEKEDCGHILASNMCGGFLRFHRKNLTIQHKKCNNPRFRPDAGVRNAINIDKRYGAGTMQWLLNNTKTEYKEPKKHEWESMIRSLKSFPQPPVAEKNN